MSPTIFYDWKDKRFQRDDPDSTGDAPTHIPELEGYYSTWGSYPPIV